MKRDDNLKKLFIEELSDVYDAEQQIIKALPACIKAAESPELKEALQGHLEETEYQVTRLKEIFSLIKAKPIAEPCQAMQGLIKECKSFIQEFEESALRDAGMIAKLQRVEHYEISAYGTLRTFAKQLDLEEAVNLLEETLKEESGADKKLTKIAEGGLLTVGINQKVNGSY